MFEQALDMKCFEFRNYYIKMENAVTTDTCKYHQLSANTLSEVSELPSTLTSEAASISSLLWYKGQTLTTFAGAWEVILTQELLKLLSSLYSL